MNVEFVIPGADAMGRVFLTWTPVEAQARLVNPTGTAAVRVTLRNAGPVGGAEVRDHAHASRHADAGAQPAGQRSAGALLRRRASSGGRASALGDAADRGARHRHASASSARSPSPCASARTPRPSPPAERDRFVAALGTFNGGGAAASATSATCTCPRRDREEHGNVGFLPWHRAYILDLERELQAIDPSVPLPYWRFDQAGAERLHPPVHGCARTAVGRVQFTAGHPFGTWRTDGALGILATPRSPPVRPRRPPHRAADDRSRRSGADRVLCEFRRHGGQPARLRAHQLHCRLHPARCPRPRAIRCSSCCTPTSTACGPSGSGCAGARARPTPRAFAPAVPEPRRASAGRHDVAVERRHRRRRRPPTAPGRQRSRRRRRRRRPGNTPTVGAMIDYQAVGGGAPLGFAYDDVPFEL